MICSPKLRPDSAPPSTTKPACQPPTAISKSLTIRLYTSHFLSTWNSRLFEAAVVYFLAAIFPNTLLPISVYALVRNAAAIVLTVPVGTWIDRANRLTILRTSILGQRISVAASCTLFWAMLRAPGLTGQTTHGLFAATVVLACIEKVLAGVNLVAVERDWVVVITEGNETARRTMNARMRRIDLFCKLLGPLAVALIATASVPVAVYITLGMNLASVFVEYICVERVYRMVPALHRQINAPPSSQVDTVGHGPPDASQTQSRAKLDTLCGMASQALMIPALRLYFSHPAAIPSFALSLLYLTVLAFSGQMLTFLLASNINQWQVGVIRAVSTVFELSATWITPRLTRHIGVLRTGLWSINWQMTWLAAGLTWFLYFHHHTTYPSTSPLPAAGLAAAVALSRAGLWGFDLSAQNIVQDEVEGDRRGLFSSVEAAIQNLFDLLAWALTIIWPDPVSFQWPVIISVVAVYAAGGLYAYFLRERRGHLVHPPRCLRPKVDDQS
ncbi:Ferroporti-1 [Staphylotrichum tortipilum]|uniref:Solute carrier family 40 member n=1 Tax=Staphylotrichum tortipilum TaxID=2831512 RepID=A0AAN6RVW5_9PEZI|nr:Ferroporti-1 [Staphylotrichum longicolle]